VTLLSCFDGFVATLLYIRIFGWQMRSWGRIYSDIPKVKINAVVNTYFE
jgi:hypothetical protein